MLDEPRRQSPAAQRLPGRGTARGNPVRDYHLPRKLYRIALDDPGEVEYWMRLFKVSEPELRQALRDAGHLRADVEAYLGI
jgi:hypothetical protein